MATTGASASNISEQFVREAPDIEAYKLGLMQSAKALPAPNLPDYQVAAMTGQQNEAIRQGQAGIGAYQPYMNAAGQNVTTGAGTIDEAADVLRGADTRGQFTAAQNAMNIAAGQTMQGGQPIGQQQIQNYMNPYTNLALGQQLQEMNRQAGMQQQGLNAQAVRAGAFGGSRQGIEQQELNRNLMQTQNQAIAQAMQQNYGQALSTAQQQQQTGLAAANQLGNLGQGIGSLAGQQFGVGQGIAQGLGSLGTQLGNMGVQQAALGQQAQTLGQNDTNFLYNLGAQQQKQNQAVLDAQRATSMQNAMQPYQQLAFQSDIYKGAPSTQMAVTTQSAASPSPFQQITGVGTGILGLAGAGKATGLI
jgi:hypothetical protein